MTYHATRKCLLKTQCLCASYKNMSSRNTASTPTLKQHDCYTMPGRLFWTSFRDLFVKAVPFQNHVAETPQSRNNHFGDMVLWGDSANINTFDRTKSVKRTTRYFGPWSLPWRQEGGLRVTSGTIVLTTMLWMHQQVPPLQGSWKE